MAGDLLDHLGNRHRPPHEVDIARPQGDRLSPPEAEDATDEDQRPVTALGMPAMSNRYLASSFLPRHAGEEASDLPHSFSQKVILQPKFRTLVVSHPTSRTDVPIAAALVGPARRPANGQLPHRNVLALALGARASRR